MLEKIIIPTEMSAAAFELLEHLKALKTYGTESVLLIQCIGPGEATMVSQGFVTSVIQNNLDQQKSILENFGFKVETRIISGLIKNEISKIAFREDVSMIVTGAQKHTLSSEIFFGGLAYDIIHHAHKPILIVRLADGGQPSGMMREEKTDDIGRNILHPTDFSENAEKAFEYLKQFAANGTRKITLMHVHDKTRFSDYSTEQIQEYDRIDMERLTGLKSQLEEIGNAEIDTIVAHGTPSVEIIKQIRETNATLVLLGSQGKGYVEELFIGSVSQNVARHSESSVMLIPALRK